MLVSEAKTGVMKWADEILGVWFPSNKFIGAAAKVALDNVWDKHEDMITTFADKQGNLKVDNLIDQLVKDYVPEQGLNLGDIFKDNSMGKFLNCKIIEREDLYKLKTILENGNNNQRSIGGGNISPAYSFK